MAHMCWHYEGQEKDGVLATQLTAWQLFHEAYPSFEAQIRNARLRLVTLEFYPFCNTNHRHDLYLLLPTISLYGCALSNLIL